MKKTGIVLLAVLLAVGLVACGSPAPTPSPAVSSGPEESPAALTKVTIGATSSPHGELLEKVKPILLEQGIELEIKIFEDYVLPNTAVADKSLDANFFQHVPYLESFNTENKTELVPIASIHYEPLGLYPGKTKTIAELKDGASIAVPNDTSNEARALMLLENAGLIKLAEGAGLMATVKDIAENPKNIKIVELQAAQLPGKLPDVDMAVINGNYAIASEIPITDALALEDKEGTAAQTYANVIVVRKGDEARPELKALCDALQTQAISDYITETYAGGVVPMF